MQCTDWQVVNRRKHRSPCPALVVILYEIGDLRHADRLAVFTLHTVSKSGKCNRALVARAIRRRKQVGRGVRVCRRGAPLILVPFAHERDDTCILD